MGKRIIIAIGLALSLFCGCTKVETVVVDVVKMVPVDPVSAYNFDGQEYTVHTLLYAESDDYLEFLVAREPEDPITSYILFYISKEFLGKTIDFANIAFTKRVDYGVNFEDPLHYYPEIYQPKSGTLKVSRIDNGFSVVLDAVFPDGKRLFFDHSGVFAQEL